MTARRFSFDPRHTPVAQQGLSGQSVPVDSINAAFLRSLFQSPPEWTPELRGDRIRLNDRPISEAAVLIPIVLSAGLPRLILTERSGDLKDHAGQIAFPGGRIDPDDLTAEAAAKREAHEEIGLNPNSIEVLGRLPTYLTGTGFNVTPIVALVSHQEQLQIEAGEVAEVFEVPLTHFLTPANHQRRTYQYPASLLEPSQNNSSENAWVERHFIAMPWMAPKATNDSAGLRAIAGKEYFVWGATAAMLRNLYLLISAARFKP